jgi:hypothetical protein
MKYVYHGRRFWIQNPTGNQHRGWNTTFEKCEVLKITAKRITINSPTLGLLSLNRAELEKSGRVYHSKPHEYFYKQIPPADPEKPRHNPYSAHLGTLTAFLDLGLVPPATRKEVDKAYKRLARKVHPDVGGSHEQFLSLNKAYKLAKQLCDR